MPSMPGIVEELAICFLHRAHFVLRCTSYFCRFDFHSQGQVGSEEGEVGVNTVWTRVSTINCFYPKSFWVSGFKDLLRYLKVFKDLYNFWAPGFGLECCVSLVARRGPSRDAIWTWPQTVRHVRQMPALAIQIICLACESRYNRYIQISIAIQTAQRAVTISKDGASASVCFGHTKKRVGAQEEKDGKSRFSIAGFHGFRMDFYWLRTGHGRVPKNQGFPVLRFLRVLSGCLRGFHSVPMGSCFFPTSNHLL